jgi:hypothetical protein
MPMTFQKISYEELNSRQQEAYNFQKVSAVLADFGIVTIPLSNDWNGADFIAQCRDGITFHKVQLKGRLTFDMKYYGKQLYICFRDGVRDHDPWYMYEHDELLGKVIAEGQIEGTKTWELKKPYHFPILSVRMKELLEPYRIPDINSANTVLASAER